MIIDFYKMDLDARVVDKTAGLTSVTSFNVKLKKKPNNIKSFNLELAMDPEEITFNYCYIPKFKRYYFIGEPVSVYNGITEVPLNCDVLFTYKKGIYNSNQLVERNAKHVNAYLYDNMVPTAFYDTVNVVQFPNSISNDSIILVTTG